MAYLRNLVQVRLASMALVAKELSRSCQPLPAGRGHTLAVERSSDKARRHCCLLSSSPKRRRTDPELLHARQSSFI